MVNKNIKNLNIKGLYDFKDSRSLKDKISKFITSESEKNSYNEVDVN